jgi:hypothetical protein
MLKSLQLVESISKILKFSFLSTKFLDYKMNGIFLNNKMTVI